MSDLVILPLTIVSVSFLLTLFFTIAARKILLRHAMLDLPNERSSHTAPVPRGGGWALLIVLVPGMLLAGAVDRDLARYGWIIAGTLLLALISWLDDKKGVSAMKRLSFHILAACIGSFAFADGATLFQGMLPFWLDRALMIIGWAWFMNLYNFMDGIDGITGTETIAIATGVCAVMTATGINDPFIANLTLLLTGACLGFLTLNWYPAKIFLGDVGSVPLGFLSGFLLLALATEGYLIPALILPLYYLADSGITLAKRAWRREKIWQAHRQHFYQVGAQSLGRHDKVVFRILAADILLIAAALIAINYRVFGLALGMLTVAILLWKLHKKPHEISAP